MNNQLFTQAAYLAAAVLFILGLKGLSSPATARRTSLKGVPRHVDDVPR